MEGNVEMSTHQRQTLKWYKDLTYLQFSINPNIFSQYVIDLLYMGGQDHQVSIMFGLYCQTLLQFYPEFQSHYNFVIDHTDLGGQLFKLLMMMIRKMPIHNTFYDGSIPVFMYSIIIQHILQQQISTDHHYSQYLQSLILYVKMLDLISKVRRDQSKLIDPQSKEDIINKAIHHQQQLIKLPSIYGIYSHNFKHTLDKLKYLFNINEKANPQQPNNHPLSQIKNSFKIPQLYIKCPAMKDKLLYIERIMQNLIKQAFKDSAKLQKAQLLCLLFLEQFKNVQLQYRSQLYTYLLVIKAIKTQQSIQQQLKQIIQLKPPSLATINVLVAGVLGLKELGKAYTMMKYLLKLYKQQQHQKQYLRLTVLAYIIESKKNKANILGLSEQLMKVPESIIYMNNIECIDYMLGMFMGSIGNDFLSGAGIWTQQQRKQLNQSMSSFLTKSSKDYLQYEEKYEKIIQLLLQKRSFMFPHPWNHRLSGQTFSTCMLGLLYTCHKGHEPLTILKNSITLLFEYGLSFREKPNQQALKLLLMIICKWLNHFHHHAETMICYELIGVMDYENVQGWMKKNKIHIGEQLWEYIVNYDLVEMLCEISGSYWPHATNWVQNNDNFQYTTEFRKNKILHTKAIKFASYLYDKINI